MSDDKDGEFRDVSRTALARYTHRQLLKRCCFATLSPHFVESRAPLADKLLSWREKIISRHL